MGKNFINLQHKLCLSLVKNEYSTHIFQGSSDIKFCENPSSGSQVASRGQRDETNSHFSKFTHCVGRVRFGVLNLESLKETDGL